MKTGFIGLGIMGKPMAKNLLKAGYELVVCDTNPGPVKELVDLGAEAVSSPREVAAKCEVVLTMLPNSPHVREVVLGENGVLEGAKPGTIIVDMSSIAPFAAKEIAAKAAEKGVDMLDAPVSGGEPKAIDGTLSFMVGGGGFHRCHEMLSKMGGSVVSGDIGAGNDQAGQPRSSSRSISPQCQALVLGAKAGVNPGPFTRRSEAVLPAHRAEAKGRWFLAATARVRIRLHQDLAMPSDRPWWVSLSR
jgi:2-hydroxy-3-oxopropionate reductase